MKAIVVRPGGVVRAVYSDALRLAFLGPLSIKRASHVEPDVEGLWWADLSPVLGPTLGPFTLRSDALAAELQWLSDRLAVIPID